MYTSVTPTLGYMELVHMELVPRQNAAILLPIISAHVAPGTTVYLDEWSAYKPNLPGVAGHCIFNHSLHFVDSTTRIHTQNIESYWAKLKLKRMKGCPKSMLSSYLDEFMWRECHMGRHQARPSIAFAQILIHCMLSLQILYIGTVLT